MNLHLKVRWHISQICLFLFLFFRIVMAAVLPLVRCSAQSLCGVRLRLQSRLLSETFQLLVVHLIVQYAIQVPLISFYFHVVFDVLAYRTAENHLL